MNSETHTQPDAMAPPNPTPASPQMPPFNFGSGDVFEDVRDCIPGRLLALAAAGPTHLGLDAPVVAAAGLAHLAASFGRVCSVDDGATCIHPCFSLAVVTDSLMPLDWLSNLGAGWIGEATKFQMLEMGEFREVIKSALRNVASERQDRSICDPQFESYVEKLPLTVVNMMRRRTITTKLDPAAVARAIVDSRDHCAVLLSGATDPMAEWSHLSPGKQQKVAEMLMLSWQGKPLTVTPQGSEVPGTVHALWLTHPGAVRKAMFDRRASAWNRIAPILLFSQHGNPKRLPDVDAVEVVQWHQLLKEAHRHRFHSSLERPAVFTLDKPARELAEEFYRQFADALIRVPESVRPYLRWLPDLPLRLFSILVLSQTLERLLEGCTSADPPVPSSSDPDRFQRVMSQAVRLTRWLCQEHYRVVCGYTEKWSTDVAEPATDSTDMTALEELIWTKLKEKGPQAPRDLQRGFHDLRAGERDKALARLKSTGRVVESADGRLEAAA